MSKFPGLLKEYRFLSIDRFDGLNLSSWAYFLSHCHTDHMVGLDCQKLSDRFSVHSQIKLFCSEVTKALLMADERHKHLAKHIETLPIECPTVINIEDDNESIASLVVTLLPAAHCPGSVMFLFEGKEGTVLYTGDFRLPQNSAKRMRHLHSQNGSKKPIDSMYVDTTFCVDNAVYIPSREDCLARLKEIVSEWFSRGENHVVRLNVSAKYGYEYLFHALYEAFDVKIYCGKRRLYKCLPETYNILTDDPTSSRIYACFKKERIGRTGQWKSDQDEFRAPLRREVLKLTLSTMHFTYAAHPHEVCQRISNDHFRLCFSFHSSHSEVCDFVKYLQPFNVFANVLPQKYRTLEEVEEKLKKDCELGIKNEKVFRPLGEFKTTVKKDVVQDCGNRKRVIPIDSTDDENSQEIWQQLAVKYSKNGNQKKNFIGKSPSKSDGGIEEYTQDNEIQDDSFIINSSPGNKTPTKNEIEDLQIKIALNNGKPI